MRNEMRAGEHDLSDFTSANKKDANKCTKGKVIAGQPTRLFISMDFD